MKRLQLLSALTLSLVAMPVQAFFGSDAAVLAPILTEQLLMLNQGLSTAKNALSEIKELKQGIDKVREVTIGYDDLYALLAENEQLVELSKNLHDIEASLEELTPLEASGFEDIPDLRHARFNRNLTKASLFLAEKFKQDTVRSEATQGAQFLEAARQAESGAEAAKIGAESTSMMVFQNSEIMALEAQQLEVQAMELEMANTQEKERVMAEHAELHQLREGIRRMPPLR